MESQNNENRINETVDSKKKGGAGFEMSSEQNRSIVAELSKFHDAINLDKPIKFEDLESLDQMARNTKIDVGGEIMTVEEAEKIPDLKMNAEIWKEMSEGNFDNTGRLTKITPAVSRYLENVKDVDLRSLTSADGLVLPKAVMGDLCLDKLKSIDGLTLPLFIGGAVDLEGLETAVGLVLPKNLSGYLDLRRINSTSGLILPENVSGSLFLQGLSSAVGLTLPRNIAGDLNLQGLTSIEGLNLQSTIGGGIYYHLLTDFDIEALRKKYRQHSHNKD